MNIPMALEAYFGRLEDEGVAPIQYRDGSSYERLRATWADERPLPDEAELEAYWRETGEALVQAWEAGQGVVSPDVDELGALRARVDELEAFIRDLKKDA